MPTTRGRAAADETEPEIPSSDDPPEDNDAPASVEEAEGSHPHSHTPGYPRHEHSGKKVQYDEAETFLHGGEAAFDQDRHDADVTAADALETDRRTAEFETPSNVAGKIAEALRADGWEVTEPDGLADQRQTSILSATRLSGRTIGVGVSYSDL